VSARQRPTTCSEMRRDAARPLDRSDIVLGSGTSMALELRTIIATP
jgi:hypothetical protein